MTETIHVEPAITLNVGAVTGADPEVFIVNSKGTVVRAKKYVQMSTSYRKETYYGRSNIIWDNVAAELQPVAGSCAQHVIDRIGMLVRSLFAVVLDPTTRKNYDICTTPAMPVTQKNRVAEVLEFGCSPALLITGQEITEVRPLIDPRECEFRSIGGHVHMSGVKPHATSNYSARQQPDGKYPKRYHSLNNMRNGKPYSGLEILEDDAEKIKLTQMFDILLGTVGCLFEYRMGNQEAALIRRMMIGYGRAGEFRVNKKSYEYRTLSPWWMDHPLLAHLMFNLSRDIYRFWECDGCADKFLVDFNDRGIIEEAINECNPVQCEQVLVRGIKAFRSVVKQYKPSAVYDTILGSSARPEHMIRVLAHKPVDWHRFLATETSSYYARETAANSGTSTRARPTTKPFSLLRRWNFDSHYWGWKDFAANNGLAKMKNKTLPDSLKPLSGTYITDHWAAEETTVKDKEEVA